MSVMSFCHAPENNLETVNHSVPAGVSEPRWVLCVCVCGEGGGGVSSENVCACVGLVLRVMMSNP